MLISGQLSLNALSEVGSDSPESGLSSTDQKVFELIASSGLGLSFQGIRRSLGIHQESLSRSLKRLTELGLVYKHGEDYWVNAEMASRPREWYVVVDSALPKGVRREDMVRRLHGRWFKELRWFGESEDGLKLVWTSQDGGYKVMLSILEQEFMVQTDTAKEEAVFTALRLAKLAMQAIEGTLMSGP